MRNGALADEIPAERLPDLDDAKYRFLKEKYLLSRNGRGCQFTPPAPSFLFSTWGRA